MKSETAALLWIFLLRRQLRLAEVCLQLLPAALQQDEEVLQAARPPPPLLREAAAGAGPAPHPSSG